MLYFGGQIEKMYKLKSRHFICDVMTTDDILILDMHETPHTKICTLFENCN
jgi:hypothetical protein